MDPILLGVFVLMIVAMYFLMIRPANKRAKEQQSTINAIQPGARVMLTSGIFGTVRHVGDKQMVIELAPGTQITVVKQAVTKVVAPEDEEFEYEDDAALPAAPADASELTWTAEDEAAAFGQPVEERPADDTVMGEPAAETPAGFDQATADEPQTVEEPLVVDDQTPEAQPAPGEAGDDATTLPPSQRPEDGR